MRRLTAVPLGALALGSAAVGVRIRHRTALATVAPLRGAGAAGGLFAAAGAAFLRRAPDARPDLEARWIRSLAALEPDLVINTGDSIAHVGAVPGLSRRARTAAANSPARSFSGRTTYAAPVFKNPARYLFPDDGARPKGDRVAVA